MTRVDPSSSPPGDDAVLSGTSDPVAGRNRTSRIRLRYCRFALLSQAERSELFHQMSTVAAEALGLEASFERSWIGRRWSARCDEYAASAEGYLALVDQRIVAYFIHESTELQGRPSTHLISAYVSPAYQGRGLAFAANARAVLRMIVRHPFSRYYVTGSVYNPVALEGWRLRAPLPGTFYPPIDGLSEPSAELMEVARAAASQHYPELSFDADEGVLRDKNPGRPPEPFACSNEQVNDRFRAVVRPQDTVLFVVDGNRRLLLRESLEVLKAIPRAVGVRIHEARRSTRTRGQPS